MKKYLCLARLVPANSSVKDFLSMFKRMLYVVTLKQRRHDHQAVPHCRDGDEA